MIENATNILNFGKLFTHFLNFNVKNIENSEQFISTTSEFELVSHTYVLRVHKLEMLNIYI